MKKEFVFYDRKFIDSVVNRWVGTPYLHGSGIAGVGTDCVQLVRGILRECNLNVLIPEEYPKDWRITHPGWVHLGFLANVPGLEEIQPHEVRFPNLVLFEDENQIVKHLGVVIDSSKFIHIMDDSLGTVRVDLIRNYAPLVYGYYRVREASEWVL